MKHVFLVSHGTFAKGLKSAIEMMTGPRNDLIAVGLEETMDINMFRAAFFTELKKIDPADEILLFCDLLGGSPFTNAMDIIKEEGFFNRSIILTGMNMPVVLHTYLNKDAYDLDFLAEEIKSIGPGTLLLFEIPPESEEPEEEL